MESNDKPTELCMLAFKYGTDKCPQLGHTYTPYYYELWNDKRSDTKKVLEMGIGNYKSRKSNNISGASLFMWRDFFPNALIYGADINPKNLFQEASITTYLCDQQNKKDLVSLINKTGSDIDIFIDDGSHRLDDQIFACLTLMPLFNKDITYIIEDVIYSKKLISALKQYNCSRPEIQKRSGINQLVVVKND